MDQNSKSHAQLRVQERTGRELPDLLRELYVDRRHSQEEIARALGVHRMTVSGWLREFGVSRDERAGLTL